METQSGGGQRPRVGGMETQGVRRPRKRGKMEIREEQRIERCRCHL